MDWTNSSNDTCTVYSVRLIEMNLHWPQLVETTMCKNYPQRVQFTKWEKGLSTNSKQGETRCEIHITNIRIVPHHADRIQN